MRKAIAIAVPGFLAITTILFFASGHVRGATEALVDQSRGRPAVYQLGCTDAPPRKPEEFRVQELLTREYRVRFITIGGIAPSRFQAHFTATYDAVGYWLMQRRYGSDFLERLERRAAAEIFTHDVTITGHHRSGSRQLVSDKRESFTLRGADSLFATDTPAERRLVRIHGRMLEIRGSNWRSNGYPEIEVRQIEIIED